jgi:Zn-dependent protease with chaperone function
MKRRTRGAAIAVCAMTAWLSSAVLSGQTVITAPPNRYTPQQDVQLGLEASRQVQQQLPIMRDDAITSYVQDIGQRLVASIPPDLRHPEFQYTFQVVNVREINAFALPGGPMFINRGMIEKAHNEGEIAGVMAHELSHVALRHGTAQATKATKYEVGEVIGSVVGAIIGGRVGNVVAQGTQFGLGTAFLRFSREYERQADILGTHIMANAGYDPRDMANVFKTIEKESGPGGPQWLSDHPNPGNRYEYITQEAQLLRVSSRSSDNGRFQQVQSRLRSMPRAPTTEEATRNGAGRTTRGTSGRRVVLGRAEPPSSQWSTYDEGNLFRVSVPSNWRELSGNNAVTFAPEGGYGSDGQESVFTHGVEIGVARNETHDLRQASDELISSLAQSNPRLSRPSGYDRASVGGASGLRTVLSNVSDATGQQERIEVYTTLLRDGTLFYTIGVAPRDEFNDYEPVFRRVVSSLQFAR